MEFLLSLVGVALILEGIPWFLSPARFRKLVVQLAALPDSVLRFVGLSFMLVGLLVVYLAVR